ncbi:hypothetical protein SRABI80_03708 [Peribacillus frigoritolerans]|nr:hypothetical protein SRABI80_03708 [Peribacillus frigoritolerans]
MLQEFGKSAKKGLETELVFDSIWKVILFIPVAFIISKLTFTLEKKRSNDQQVKTLYDDEIAEIRLLESVKSLSSIGVKVIFVIDELDKIEDDKAIETLIGELKPLFLSGEATFILVTGQQYVQKLEKSTYELDPVLPSLFSNSYHIPLLTKEGLDQHFKEIVHFPENALELSEFSDKQKLYYESFRDAMILRSNRITRKFIMLLKSEVNWSNADQQLSKRKIRSPIKLGWNKEGQKFNISIELQKPVALSEIVSHKQGELTYIEITKNNYIEYQNDIELQNILQNFYKDVLETNDNRAKVYKKEEKDFLLEFMHIIVQRIKDTFGEGFTRTDTLALDKEGTSQDKYPSRYLKNLERISKEFFAVLKDNNLVSVAKLGDKEKGVEILYEYTPTLMSKEQIETVKNKYIFEYYNVCELIEEMNRETLKIGSTDMIEDLKNTLFEFGIPNPQITYLENKLILLQKISKTNEDEDVQGLMSNYRAEFLDFENLILEYYTEYIGKKIIEQDTLLSLSNNQDKPVVGRRRPGPDVVLHLEGGFGFLGFEIRIILGNSFTSKGQLMKIIENGKKELERIKEKMLNSKLILIIFCEFEVIEKVQDILRKDQKIENEHFKILTINKNRVLDDKTFREYIEEVIKDFYFEI